MTLTLEPRLPKGCEADRFLGGTQSAVGRRFLRTNSRLWAWQFPGQMRAQRLMYSFTHLHFFLLSLIHSFIAMELPPAPLTQNCSGKGHLWPNRIDAFWITAQHWTQLLPPSSSWSPLLFIRLESQATRLSSFSSHPALSVSFRGCFFSACCLKGVGPEVTSTNRS